MQNLVPANFSAIEPTAALVRVREQSTTLASLLALDKEIASIFLFRLTQEDTGQKALLRRGANIEAIRNACAHAIGSAILGGIPIKVEVDTSVSRLLERAMELANANPDPGVRVASICDVVDALYEQAKSDAFLRQLLEGRRAPSLAEHLATEARAIALVLERTVGDRIEDAERKILEEMRQPRGVSITSVRVAAGVALLFGLVLLATRWWGFADVQLALASLQRIFA